MIRLMENSLQSRQEVCESFDWFRSYQSGVYFMKDMVKGYLLSAFSSRCDPRPCKGLVRLPETVILVVTCLPTTVASSFLMGMYV